MFNPEKLKVGDVFYSVKERNQAFNRKKIQMELDGVDWFRYDRPLRTYEIVKHKVLGIIRKELEGEWPKGEICELQTGFNIHSSSSNSEYSGEYYFSENKKYFVDLRRALEYKSQLEAETKQLDRK
jgi:hypothetical protein